MRVIEATNVQEALKLGLGLLAKEGVKRESRAGDVLLMDCPVATRYAFPDQRVLFWAERDANPFFHFMEGLWMLAGRSDVAWISQFNSTIDQFSDDGVSFHGSYGQRWINHFTECEYREGDGEPFNIKYMNQLERIIKMLKENPNERRCVLQMWDAETDLGHKGKDVPCNTQIIFSISVYGNLDMSVFNRSNDIVWGAYGANAVHMSMLQEFMAAAIGVPIGEYWQISNNWHSYLEVFEKHKCVKDLKWNDPYDGEVEVYPMVNSPINEWLEDLEMFISQGVVTGSRDKFFRKVVHPMWNAWFAWKNKDDKKRIDTAIALMQDCQATDWKKACVEWLERRRK